MRKWPCICFGLLLLAASLTGCSDRDSAAASGTVSVGTADIRTAAECGGKSGTVGSSFCSGESRGRRNAGGICRNPNCFHDKRYQSGRADGRL